MKYLFLNTVILLIFFFVLSWAFKHLLFLKITGEMRGKFPRIIHLKDVKIGDTKVDSTLNPNLVSVSSVIFFVESSSYC